MLDKYLLQSFTLISKQTLIYSIIVAIEINNGFCFKSHAHALNRFGGLLIWAFDKKVLYPNEIKINIV